MAARQRTVLRSARLQAVGRPRRGLDTHVYSVDPDECESLPGLQWGGAWTLESRDAFRVGVPDASGACPDGELPVHRLWNAAPDANHRYTTSRTERDALIAEGGG